jgi:phasin family protein
MDITTKYFHERRTCRQWDRTLQCNKSTACRHSSPVTFPKSQEITMANYSLEQIAANNKSALDTLHAFATVSLNSLEKLSFHNLESTRNALEEQLDSSKSWLGAKNLHEAFSVSGVLSQPQIEKNIAYLRGIYDISTAAQDELIKLFERGHSELNKSITSHLDWYSKSPANSEFAVAAVKSAISAANSAFENTNKTVRQVANIAEASVNAASSATSRAVDAANSSSRKKAA